ncbi:MAG: hypothetical protein KJ737_25100 [Proteobacteria bacterium]|nr:hypothetical protein [Pseudomonadota bacterium]
MASLTKIEELLDRINASLVKKSKYLELKRTNAYFLIVLNGHRVIKSGLTMAKTQIVLEGMLEGIKLAFSRKSSEKTKKNPDVSSS